jgi:hypothetical protein
MSYSDTNSLLELITMDSMGFETSTAEKFLRLYGKPTTSRSNAWLMDVDPEALYAARTPPRTAHDRADGLNVNDFETMEAHVKSVLLQQGYRKTRPIPEELQHDPRLTFGLELEMVIARKPKKPGNKDEGLEILQQSFQRLNRVFPRQFPSAMYWKNHTGPVFCGEADRTKFLIQRDESIQARIRPKSWVVVPRMTTDPVPSAKAISKLSDQWRVPRGSWGWVKESTGKPFNPQWEKERWWCALGEATPETVVEGPSPKKKRDEYLSSREDKCFILGSPVEMCTPIMTQTTYSNTLKRCLHWISSDLPLHFGESMGLHVHVGCGVGQKWSLAELQAIGKGLILWESALDSYHASWRRKGTWMCNSNRYNPGLAKLTILEAFAKIDRCTTLDEFYRVVGEAKFQKYNFRANSLYGTIEFRQAEAYGDHVRANKWIHLLSCLVSCSLVTEPYEWIAWARMVGMGGYNLRELPQETWERFGLDAELRARFEEHNPPKWSYGDEKTRCDRSVHSGLCCYLME